MILVSSKVFLNKVPFFLNLHLSKIVEEKEAIIFSHEQELFLKSSNPSFCFILPLLPMELTSVFEQTKYLKVFSSRRKHFVFSQFFRKVVLTSFFKFPCLLKLLFFSWQQTVFLKTFVFESQL